MTDLDEFGAMNQIYEDYFKDSKPARTTFQAGKLPINSR
jgi:enamine deaminase RidA (YjgF/YER057c/UK114 family)